MAVDFTEKAKRFQAIDEIIASGRKLKWNQIISELNEVYNIKTIFINLIHYFSFES